MRLLCCSRPSTLVHSCLAHKHSMNARLLTREHLVLPAGRLHTPVIWECVQRPYGAGRSLQV